MVHKESAQENVDKTGDTNESMKFRSEAKHVQIEHDIVLEIIKNRANLIKTGIAELGEAMGLDRNDQAQRAYLTKLVSTDLFVEKAQRFLTDRSNELFRLGIGSLIAAVAVLLIAAYVAYNFLHDSPPDPGHLTGYVLALRFFQAAAFTTFVLSSVYVLQNFAKSFYHEGTKLRERRHALRFGRLYMYLDGATIDIKEYERIFDWNRDTTTAFQQIKDIPLETLQAKIVAMIPEMIKASKAGEGNNASKGEPQQDKEKSQSSKKYKEAPSTENQQ